MAYKKIRIKISGYYKIVNRKRVYVPPHYKTITVWVPSKRR